VGTDLLSVKRRRAEEASLLPEEEGIGERNYLYISHVTISEKE